MPAFVIQLNIFWNSIIFKEKKVSFFTIIKCYSNRCVQNADCRLHTGGVGLSFLDRLIFLHSWWESNETFLGVASVISRPATCLVSIGHFRITFDLFFKASLGAHLFIWKLVFICMWIKANFHMKRWAPGLALKKRPKVIRKWPIAGKHFFVCVNGSRAKLKTFV